MIDDAGFTYHYRMQNQHGPYTAAAFKGGSGLANSMLSKSAAIEMDALASVNHIGMIYQPNTAYNTDRIVEAKCEACGTGIWSRTYRGDPAYSGVRRYRMGALRTLVGVLLLALAGCGGGDSPPQLVDGSAAASLPAELDALDGAVLTRTEVTSGERPRPGRVRGLRSARRRRRQDRRRAHGPPRLEPYDRVGTACCSGATRSPIRRLLRIPICLYGGIWCASPNGRIDDGGLNDPRLDLCTNTDSELTAFAWVEPQPDAKWVVVSDAGTREVYEVAESLPVRVTTTDGTQPESSRASFDIEEYAADGSKLPGVHARSGGRRITRGDAAGAAPPAINS